MTIVKEAIRDSQGRVSRVIERTLSPLEELIDSVSHRVKGELGKAENGRARELLIQVRALPDWADLETVCDGIIDRLNGAPSLLQQCAFREARIQVTGDGARPGGAVTVWVGPAPAWASAGCST